VLGLLIKVLQAVQVLATLSIVVVAVVVQVQLALPQHITLVLAVLV
jgi:hypothetical protein